MSNNGQEEINKILKRNKAEDKVPMYFKTLDGIKKRNSMTITEVASVNGAVFLPEKFYKPICKII